MKKILFIGMTPNKGGIETFCINVFSKLKNRYKFEFLNIFPKKLAYSNYIIRNGGIIRHELIRNNFTKYFVRYKKALDFFSKHHNYDVVHLNTTSINGIFWLKAAEKFGIKKLIIHSHNDKIQFTSKFVSLGSKLLSFFSRMYLNHHTNILKLAASVDAGRWMFKSDKFKIINNCIDTEKFLFDKYKRHKIRIKLNIPNKTYVLVIVARLESQKNLFRLLRIFKCINNSFKNVKLIIVGNGHQQHELIKYSYILHISNYIIFTGFIDNVNDILDASDLMVMPSLYEAFPFSLVEAQSAGVPAVVSSDAISNEVNITGKLCYISLRQSNKYWAHKIIYILKHNVTYSEKINMNMVVNKSGYGICSLIKQIVSIYD